MRFAKKHAARHVQSAAPAKCCVCHAQRRKSIAPVTKKGFRHVMQSAMPATRNEATRHQKLLKLTPFAALPIGTAKGAFTRTLANACERLRTAADGCGRLRHVWRTHPKPPNPQSETGTLATDSGTQGGQSSHANNVDANNLLIPCTAS